MDMTLKAMSVLLSYPTIELQKDASRIAQQIMTDQRLDVATLEALTPFIASLSADDIYDLQERYVMLFDRSRTLSLNLFEHVHGESRDRGGAMVSLLETYRDGGFEPATSELPDHLPVLLEFLSTQPACDAQDILADTAHILEALQTRLSRRESPYVAVFAALLDLANAKADTDAVSELLEQPDDDPNDLEALDEVWEESEVLFGPDPNAGCPQVREMLSRMDTPIKPTPHGVSGLAAE